MSAFRCNTGPTGYLDSNGSNGSLVRIRSERPKVRFEYTADDYQNTKNVRFGESRHLETSTKWPVAGRCLSSTRFLELLNGRAKAQVAVEKIAATCLKKQSLSNKAEYIQVQAAWDQRRDATPWGLHIAAWDPFVFTPSSRTQKQRRNSN